MGTQPIEQSLSFIAKALTASAMFSSSHYEILNLEEAAGQILARRALIASGGFSSAVVVALPVGDDEVTYSDGDSCPIHQTIAYLGDVSELSDDFLDTVHSVVSSMASSMSKFDAMVSGSAVLGKDEEPVVITESHDLQLIHDRLLEDPAISERYYANAFPTWISHVTGINATYGDTVQFDRLGVWVGEDRTIYDLRPADQESDTDT